MRVKERYCVEHRDRKGKKGGPSMTLEKREKLTHERSNLCMVEWEECPHQLQYFGVSVLEPLPKLAYTNLFVHLQEKAVLPHHGANVFLFSQDVLGQTPLETIVTQRIAYTEVRLPKSESGKECGVSMIILDSWQPCMWSRSRATLLTAGWWGEVWG